MTKKKTAEPVAEVPAVKTTKGYKVTNQDMTCLGYQYEVGKRFKIDGPIEICETGFHFCEKVADCFNYYSFSPENRVFEVIAYGELDSRDDKHCCGEIEFVRELTWEEMLSIANEGKGNTGLSNTGNRNTGNRNTGNWNTGNWNTGYSNTGNRNTGAFCTVEPPFTLFDLPTAWTHEDVVNSDAFRLMRNCVDTKQWVPEHLMTEEEKAANKGWEAAEGFIRDIPFKEAFTNAWHNWSENNRKAFTSLPNFDAKKFEHITGVKVD